MSEQVAALASTHLSDRRRSLLAWGLPLGIWSAFIVAIFPSIEGTLSKAVDDYPPALKEAFGIGELSSVEQYLNAEMLSLIVPLALGYLAVRAIASGLSGAAESGRLDVLLSAPVSRTRVVAAGFLATAIELAAVLAITIALTMVGSVTSGADLPFGDALAGYANVWPPALLFAALGVVATRWSLRTSVVTGSVAGMLVTMYLIDLIGRLDDDLSGIRYASVFKYYGNAIENGIEPVAFCGIVAVALLLAGIGARLFERRDIPG
jgi:beta-exotoxin I transport system permease protein